MQNAIRRCFVVVTVGALVSTIGTASAQDRADGASAEQAARIETIIEGITHAVDIRRFDLLERYYAASVVADYSSLWGNAPRTLARSEIGDAWAGFIPGFDTTRHTITNINVDIDGDRAQASADVHAAHWLAGATWVISGIYRYEFVREADRWVVESWAFVLENEQGDRGLVDVAEERAAVRR